MKRSPRAYFLTYCPTLWVTHPSFLGPPAFKRTVTAWSSILSRPSYTGKKEPWVTHSLLIYITNQLRRHITRVPAHDLQRAFHGSAITLLSVQGPFSKTPISGPSQYSSTSLALPSALESPKLSDFTHTFHKSSSHSQRIPLPAQQMFNWFHLTISPSFFPPKYFKGLKKLPRHHLVFWVFPSLQPYSTQARLPVPIIHLLSCSQYLPRRHTSTHVQACHLVDSRRL